MTINTLKIRDDHVPLQFAADGDTFKLQAGSEASWLSGETFGHKELRSRIGPWLTSLFQSEHLSLLAGSGLTHAVHYLAAGKPARPAARFALTTIPPRHSTGLGIGIAGAGADECAARAPQTEIG